MKPKLDAICLRYQPLLSPFIFVTLLLATLVLPGYAQSGRKIPNKPKPPATTPPEAAESKPQPKPEVPKVPLLIAYGVENLNISRFYSQAVTESCASRLGESDIRIQMGKEMTRSDAATAAKKSEDSFVVLIQLSIDSFDSRNSGMGGYVDPRYLLVEYTLFEPKTGKIKTSGRIYQRRSLNEPLSLPQSPAASEQRLRRAGEEAADRIIAAMSLPIPPPRR